MKVQKLLTIVVPVYKVEQYINKCLDSCIVHTSDGSLDEEKMNQLEVIIVNDGTPDRSAELSREYIVRYPQTFRQIDKKNGGHGSAWNVGLKEATGKYLRFLDSDDWLTNLDKLMEKLMETDADVVLTNYIKVNNRTKEEQVQIINSASDVTLPITKELLYSQNNGPFVLNFWHSTYRTAILQPQWPLFEEGVMYDDSILSHAPLLYGRNCLFIDMPLYNYLVGRPGQSMSKKVMARNVNSYIRCYERQEKWMIDAFSHPIPEEFKTCIAESIQHYACVVFGQLINLPYREAKQRMPIWYQKSYWNSQEHQGKMAKRYRRFPFFIFYPLEKVRRFIKI